MPLNKNNIPNTQRALVLQGGGALGAYESGALTGCVRNLLMNIEKDHYLILLLVHR